MIHLVEKCIMKVILISVLLFFELCSGFTVHLQHKRSAETDIRAPGQTDVYEVNEGDQHTVKLTHPKPEKPTLREIVYYHLIEYPYENQDQAKNETLINGEGSNADGDHNRGDDDDNDDDDNITQRNEDGEDGDEQDYSEGQDGMGEYQLSEDGEEASFKLDVRNKKEQAKLRNVNENDQNNVVPSDKTKSARTVLFDQAKAKYSNERRQQKPSPKRKREISYKDMPPAPTLAPLNLGILPDYIRRLIPTPESVTSKPKTTLKDHLTHFDEEDFSEELEKKIDAMISSLDSEDERDNTDEDDGDDDSDDYSEESDDDDEDDSDDDQENSSNNDVEDKDTIIKRRPRTFGMNLTMGRGYVWNDLLSEPGMPGMSFDIGEQGHDSENTQDEAILQLETTKKPNTSEKPEESKKPNESELSIPFEPFTNVPHPTESRPIHSEDSSSDDAPHHASNNDKNADDEDIKGKPEKDLEDIDINSFKPKLLPDTENSEEKEDEHKKYKNDKESKPTTTDVTKNNDYDAEEHTLKPNKENHSNQASKHKKDKRRHKQIFKPENDDSLKELMKNEQFWKWLSDWTSTYMELLMKHIKEMVHDEVSRQIKALELKKDTPLKENNERDTKEKEVKVDSHNISNDNSKDDSNFIHDDKEFIGNKNENSIPDNKTSIHDDSRLLIDGKSDAKTIPFPDDNLLLMPFTHTTNFDLNKESNEPNYNKNFSEDERNDLVDFLRNKKHKNDNENSKKPDAVNKSNKGKHDKSRTRISATNISGNAVGSYKVTNIFVFYPSNDENFEKDSILSSLRPPTTGENNIFVSGKPDKVNVDTRVPEISQQKDESTMTENDSNKSTEKINDNMATYSNLLEKNKEVKGGNTEQDSQTKPPTTTPKENEKTQNTSDKIEQENKAAVKDKNTTDQPKDGDLSKDVKTTTESANSIEMTTVSSLVEKEQEDIKTLDLENKDTGEFGNKTVSPVTERNLDNKTQITTDKTDQQDITEHKESVGNTEYTEKLTEEQVKELEGRISKELEAKFEKELQTKIEQEFSKAIEKELNKAKDKEIDKDSKAGGSPKEESDKEADTVTSVKDSEKIEDNVVLAA